MFRRSKQRRKHQETELDITAFMNLMVILVPFLLITAVFSRVTILDLYLPPQSETSDNEKNTFQLEVIVTNSSITIQENQSRLRQTLTNIQQDSELHKLGEILFALKSRFPDKKDISVLAAPDVKYDLLVKVMDQVRMREVVSGKQVQLQELFPSISIGDAPLAKK